MAMRFVHVSIVMASALALASCGQKVETASTKGPAQVDGAHIVSADSESGNWMTYGRTYSEQRFSPLKQINDSNTAQLGLAWSFDLDTARGQEATPLVIDGVMYFSTAWSMVKALDAKTGALKWAFDPKVPREQGVKVCCDVVNRGVAAWNGNIYVGTLDGRLIAINAANGEQVWSVQTTDTTKPYSITGAPRVVKGKVLIGNSGAEFGVRGYISAYDAQTGEMVWRFYTVPGDPAKPDNAASDKILAEKAASTWGDGGLILGGGGTVWDSIVYDPDLDLLYFGTGNASPWTQGYRGKIGDNLFLASIVAVRPDTGEYVWHYQEVPGDEWDYTSVQSIILADVQINGQTRKALLHAPKNGFFYVLDREDGGLISAEPFSRVTWASGIDRDTGRPIEHPDARYSRTGKAWVGYPGPHGAHNWNPMAFSPATGYAYIPAQEIGSTYKQAESFGPRLMGFNTGLDRGTNAGANDPATQQATLDAAKGYLLAWDPVNKKAAWRVEHRGPGNGGVLATAGNLVMQGTYAGDFVVYRADTGEKLWSMPAQTSIIAAPMTYEVDGEQYVAVLAGTGGAYALTPGLVSLKSGPVRNISRVLAFKLGGTATLPAASAIAREINPPSLTATPAVVADGSRLYAANCGVCHGGGAISGGIVPDLRSSPFLGNDGFFDIVLNGSLKERGMVSFSEVINREQAEAIRAYVISQAQQTRTVHGGL